MSFFFFFLDVYIISCSNIKVFLFLQYLKYFSPKCFLFNLKLFFYSWWIIIIYTFWNSNFFKQVMFHVSFIFIFKIILFHLLYMYFMKVCTTFTIKPSFLSYNFTFLHKLYNIFFFVSSDLTSTINSHNLYILLLLLLLNLPLKFLIIKKNNMLKTFVNIFGKSSSIFSIFSFFILLTIIFNFSLFSPLEDRKKNENIVLKLYQPIYL